MSLYSYIVLYVVIGFMGTFRIDGDL